MQHTPATDPYWKHTSGEPWKAYDGKEIHLYDDDEPGFVSIYISDGTNTAPARTVNLSEPAHAKSVIDSWCSRDAKIRDFRKH
jgi:hypothetical protein